MQSSNWWWHHDQCFNSHWPAPLITRPRQVYRKTLVWVLFSLADTYFLTRHQEWPTDVAAVGIIKISWTRVFHRICIFLKCFYLFLFAVEANRIWWYWMSSAEHKKRLVMAYIDILLLWSITKERTAVCSFAWRAFKRMHCHTALHFLWPASFALSNDARPYLICRRAGSKGQLMPGDCCRRVDK